MHPSGDHVVIGSFDCVVDWFDLDLSSAPYKAMRYHKKGVRQTVFHSRWVRKSRSARVHALLLTCCECRRMCLTECVRRPAAHSQLVLCVLV